MATAITLVPLSEYLEGELLERNVGEWDHCRLQVLLGGYLSNREKQVGESLLCWSSASG